MASAPAVAAAAAAPTRHWSSAVGVTSTILTPARAEATAQPYEPYEFAPLDPLLAQAEELEHALIRERFHHASTSNEAFTHLRTPIPSVPTTAPAPQKPRQANAFLDLPTELHIELAKHLPFPTAWSLKRVSHHFHSIPELSAPISFFHLRHRGKAYQQTLLLALCSQGIVRRGYEPCYACRRFRWKTHFEIAQYQRGFLWCDGGEDVLTYGRLWSNDKEGDVFENGKFCIECGVKAGKYKVGEMVDVVQDWSDYHSDRKTVVVEAPPVEKGHRDEDRKTGGVMISMQGEEDLERKFNECGRFACTEMGCCMKLS